MEELARDRERRRAVLRRRQEEEAEAGQGAEAAAPAEGGRPPPTATDPSLSRPEGWEDCPPAGDLIEVNGAGVVLPCKAPLGRRFDAALRPEERFTPRHVVELVQARHKRQVGLVMNLTNTTRYYDQSEWHELDVPMLQVRCAGRDGAPEPEAVNEFCYYANRFMYAEAERAYNMGQGPEAWRVLVVHCTHGFNRTGAMICHLLQRGGKPNLPRWLMEFAHKRPPGVYKDNYINSLFEYYHEPRPPQVRTPPEPRWKQAPAASDAPPLADGDVPDDDIFGTSNVDYMKTSATHQRLMPELPGPEGMASGTEGDLRHDMLLGEPIPREQEAELQRAVDDLVFGSGNYKRAEFPGSQPVSLERSNLSLLSQYEYTVTWKADGTRYMLLILINGSYLIDRKFTFRRCQMRFPRPKDRSVPNPKPLMHHATLLDGEMVVDEDPQSGHKTLRYLAYDLLVLNGVAVLERDFVERWELIESELYKPRVQHGDYIKQGAYSPYRFDKEPWRFRRKAPFVPLRKIRAVLEVVVPQLTHEHDGLIFQAARGPYVPRTCQELLKFKYAHLNSVDFLVRTGRGGNDTQLLLGGAGDSLRVLPGATVRDEAGEPLGPEWDGRIAECVYDRGAGVWVFLRERTDKTTPNFWGVYEKVWQSITDNIETSELVALCDPASAPAPPISAPGGGGDDAEPYNPYAATAAAGADGVHESPPVSDD